MSSTASPASPPPTTGYALPPRPTPSPSAAHQTSRVMRLGKYKTVMCQRMLRSGSCRFGDLCDFAHAASEVRRNYTTHWYFPVMCQDPACAAALSAASQDPSDAGRANKAAAASSCQYAHNQMEIDYHPYVYKSKLCDRIQSPQGCPKKNYCAFAHGEHELRRPTPLTTPPPPQTIKVVEEKAAAPPAPLSPASDHSSSLSAGSNPVAPSAAVASNAAVAAPTPVSSAVPTANGVPPAAGPNGPGVSGYSGQDKDFVQLTQHLKVQMLDLADQLAGIHFERAVNAVLNMENSKMGQVLHEASEVVRAHKDLLLVATSLAESALGCLRGCVDHGRRLQILSNLYSGEGLMHLTPQALEELSKQNQLAAVKIEEARNAALASSEEQSGQINNVADFQAKVFSALDNTSRATTKLESDFSELSASVTRILPVTVFPTESFSDTFYNRSDSGTSGFASSGMDSLEK